MDFKCPEISISGTSLYHVLDKLRLTINAQLTGSKIFKCDLMPYAISTATIRNRYSFVHYIYTYNLLSTEDLRRCSNKIAAFANLIFLSSNLISSSTARRLSLGTSTSVVILFNERKPRSSTMALKLCESIGTIITGALTLISSFMRDAFS